MNRMLMMAMLSASLAIGCRGNSDGAEGPDHGGPTGAETEGGGPCEKSVDCFDGEICAAPYGGAGAPEDFVCMSECIEEDVDALWCADDAACCEGLSCDMLGFCRGPSSETSGA